ncbi:MAG: hypothetical protein WCH98_00910 [Verrucomicrobiota bacterium]
MRNICSLALALALPVGLGFGSARADERFHFTAQYDPSVGDNLKPAIQKALDIWNGWLTNTASGNAASAEILFSFQGFDSALAVSVPSWWGTVNGKSLTAPQFMVATGSDLFFQDGGISVNSNQPWYLGTDGNVPVGSFDLTTVTLHEIAHNMGMISSYFEPLELWGLPGTLGQGLTLYDSYLRDQQGHTPKVGPNGDLVVAGFVVTSGANVDVTGTVYFDGPNARASNGGQPVPVYTVSPFKDGTSLLHLSDGVPNALLYAGLTPGVAGWGLTSYEVGMMRDLGWDFVSHSGEYLATGVSTLPFQHGGAWEGGLPPGFGDNIHVLAPQNAGNSLKVMLPAAIGRLTIDGGGSLLHTDAALDISNEAQVDGTVSLKYDGNGNGNPILTATSAPFRIGVSGNGKFEQLCGQATFSDLYVGQNAASTDSNCEVSGGEIITRSLHVGVGGNAAFVTYDQGTHTASGDIVLGELASGDGTYCLFNDGLLNLGGNIRTGLGKSTLQIGTGTIIATHGTADIQVQNLIFGAEDTRNPQAFSLQPGLNVTADNVAVQQEGRLTLNGGVITAGRLFVKDGAWDHSYQPLLTLSAGYLTVDQESIGTGAGDRGSLIQTGGTHFVTGNLTVGGDGGGWLGEGEYDLSGGTLRAAHADIGSGNSGQGTFKQTGGTVTIKSSFLWYGGGSIGIGDQPNSTGSYTISGGTLDAATAQLKIGHGQQGTLTLSGQATVIADILTIGPNGSIVSAAAADNQTVLRANTLVIAPGAAALSFSSTLQLGIDSRWLTDSVLPSGVSLTVGKDLVVGHAASATLAQSGGDVVVQQALRLAASEGVTARYTLSNGTLSANELMVGAFLSEAYTRAEATFIQTGGSVTVGDYNGMQTGAGYGSTGRYELSGGTLDVHNHYVGYGGIGTFVQTGGSHLAGYLALGYFPDSEGTYTLSNGSLSTGFEAVGQYSRGNFTQTGGTNIVAVRLDIGCESSATGTYNLSGGSLIVNGNLRIGLNGGTGTLHLTGSGLLAADTITVGSNGTFDIPTSAGANNATLRVNRFLDWTGSLQIGADLQIGHPAGGSGTGNMTLAAGQDLTTRGKLVIGYSAPATMTQSGGHLMTVSNFYVGYLADTQGTYQLNAGSIDALWDQYIGYQGQGYFNQAGGTHNSFFTYLGKSAGSSGSYSLSGGTWKGGCLIVGDLGAGNVTQSGGIANLGQIDIGKGSGSRGTYALTGGQLNASGIDIGRLGSGTLQLGGTATLVANSITLHANGTIDSPIAPDNLSTLRLNCLYGRGNNTTLGSSIQLGYAEGYDPGSMSVSYGQTLSIGRDLTVGYTAAANFSQYGGTTHIAGELRVGEGSAAPGTYSLSGGSVTAASLNVGCSGAGTMSHSGGTLAVDADVVLGVSAGGNGTYTLTGGTLDARQGWFYIGQNGSGSLSLDQSGTLIADALVLGANGTFSSPVAPGNHSALRVNALYGFGDTFATGGSLQLGHDGASCGGAFTVAPGQVLSVGRDLTLGYSAQATLEQTGGSVAVGGNVILAADASFGFGTEYTLRSGTLDVRNGRVTVGQNAPATLTLRGDGVLIADTLTFGDQGTLSTFIDSASPPQYPTLRINTLENAPSNLTVPRLQLGHDGGSAEASHTVAPGQTLTVYGDLSVGYQTVANFMQSGNVTVSGYTYVAELGGSQADYVQTAGTLSGGQLWVGYQGTGAYAQSGGINSAYGLCVGGQAGSVGVYTLSGGTADNRGLAVGRYGRGTFNQQGGTANFMTAITLGVFSTGEGTYTLGANSTLNAGHIDVGYFGAGTFNQQGSALHLTSSLYLAHDAAGTGTYNLSAGTLTTDESAYIGYAGTGQFIQTGGSHALRTSLYVGYSAGSSGNYELRGGNLYSFSWSAYQDQFIGYSGHGTFLQTGGMLYSIGNIVLGQNANSEGAYIFSGDSVLMADSLTVGRSGQGTFTQTAGIAQVGAASIAVASGSTGTLAIRGGQFDVGNGTLSAGSDGGIGHLELGGSGQLLADRITLGAGSTFTCDPLGSANTSLLRINHISGVDALQVDRFQIGHASASGSFTLSSNQSLAVGHDLAVGYTTAGEFAQTGGLVDVAGDVVVGVFGSSSGSYTLSGGTLRVGGALTKGASLESEFIHNGGTLEFTGGTQSVNLDRVTLANSSGNSIQHTIGDSPSDSWSANTLTVGNAGSATIRQVGGTVYAGTLVVGGWSGGAGSYEFTGGTLSGSALTVRGSTDGEGTFRGFGNVTMTGQLVNNGRIIADGEGAPGTLDLSTFSTVINSISNAPGESNGWFAINKARLILPAIRLNSFNQTYNWGESMPFLPRMADNPGIDMINSVQVIFHGLIITLDSPSFLDISLLAADREDIVATLPEHMRLIGLWDVHPDNAIFSDADVSFRYDDMLAPGLGIGEDALRVFHYNGAAWQDVTTGLDTTNKWIYASGRTDFSYYAVGVIPEPATLGMLVLAAVALLPLRRRLPP